MAELPDNVNIIVAARGKAYGHPKTNFQNIAGLWAAHISQRHDLQVPFDEDDIASMMILLKLARLYNGYHEDSVDDIAGYAKTIHMLHPEKIPKDMDWEK